MPRAPRKAITVESSMVMPKLDIRVFNLLVDGDSPLISHAWSAKNKKQISDKQAQMPEQPKEARNPQEEYEESLYPHPDGGYGFPASGFKSAAVDACSYIKGITKVEARGAFHVIGNLLKIDGTPRMGTDTVRIGMGSGELRYRGYFDEWSVTIPVRHNAAVLSAAQIVQLFDLAGFSVGIGDWRPQKSGSNGMFHVRRTRAEA